MKKFIKKFLNIFRKKKYSYLDILLFNGISLPQSTSSQLISEWPMLPPCSPWYCNVISDHPEVINLTLIPKGGFTREWWLQSQRESLINIGKQIKYIRENLYYEYIIR